MRFQALKDKGRELVSIGKLDEKEISHGKPVEFGISWASYGTVSLDDARMFVKELQKKIGEVQGINNLI